MMLSMLPELTSTIQHGYHETAYPSPSPSPTPTLPYPGHEIPYHIQKRGQLQNSFNIIIIYYNYYYVLLIIIYN